MGDDSLGVLLRRLRLAADFTLEALAEHSGVGVRTISDIERGISLGPQHRTMELVSDALRLDDDVRHALLAAARSGRSRRPSGGHGRPALPRSVTDFAGRRHEMDTPTAEVMSGDIEDATALWQSVLADRRVLVVLDNAATEDQVWAAALRGTAVVLQRMDRREERSSASTTCRRCSTTLTSG
jgi:transcriptional regulator with XRE-family HTH domain